MKVVISNILLLSLVVHIFFSTGYVVDYYLHMEAYVQQCINKDRPIIQCHGKCQLAKKINESQKGNQHTPAVTVSLSYEYLGSIFHFEFFTPQYQNIHPARWENLYAYSWHANLIKPPISTESPEINC